MKKKELENEINSYFDNKSIPQLDNAEKDRLKNKINENKNAKPCRYHLKLTSILACLLILIITPCIVLPLTLRQNKKSYGDNQLSQTLLEREYVQDIISTKYPKYNFIFDDCKLQSMYGYFSPDKENKLLAMTFRLEKYDIPYTKCNAILVMEKNFIYSQHKNYILNAEITQTEDYKLYINKEISLISNRFLSLFEYKNYKLYLNFEINDQEFFEKFC